MKCKHPADKQVNVFVDGYMMTKCDGCGKFKVPDEVAQ